MTFDLKRKTTGNVHVRRAISQAINKKQLVATVLHAGRPANGIVALSLLPTSLPTSQLVTTIVKTPATWLPTT